MASLILTVSLIEMIVMVVTAISGNRIVGGPFEFLSLNHGDIVDPQRCVCQ